MANKPKMKNSPKKPKLTKKKYLIIGLSLMLILIISVVVYLILNKPEKDEPVFKPTLTVNLTSMDFTSCTNDNEESCEYIETRNGKTIKINYFINHIEDNGDAFLTINDELVLNDFYELKDKIYFLEDIIILSVNNLEKTNTTIHILDLDGKELKKIEQIDENFSGMKISNFTVKGREIIIDATNLVDEIHYLTLENNAEEHLYVCNFKDNNFTGKEMTHAKYIIKYNGNNEFSKITIDKKNITTLNDYIKTINCDEEPNLVGKLEEVPVVDQPVE